MTGLTSALNGEREGNLGVDLDKSKRLQERIKYYEDKRNAKREAQKKLNRHVPSGATIIDLEGKDRKRAKRHAEMYYESVQHKDNDVKRISTNTGISINEIQQIKNYLFIDEHDLEENGVRRFFPDFMIAQSWQRLESGKDIQPHDLTLLHHEIEERRLMVEEHLTQSEAHLRACEKFNYPKEAEEYYDLLKKYKENGRMD